MERAAGCLAFSHDGELFAVAGGTGEVKIWQTTTGAFHVRLTSPKWSTILCLVWSKAVSICNTQ